MKYFNKLTEKEIDKFLKKVGFPIVPDRHELDNVSGSYRDIFTRKQYFEGEDCYKVLFHDHFNDIGFKSYVNWMQIVVNDFEILSFSKRNFQGADQGAEITLYYDNNKFRKFLYNNFGEEYKKDCKNYLTQQLKQKEAALKTKISYLEKEINDLKSDVKEANEKFQKNCNESFQKKNEKVKSELKNEL